MSNRPKDPGIPMEVLRFVLAYDATKGTLHWRVGCGGRSGRGRNAGCSSTHGGGYPVVSLFGRRLFAHHIAWALHYGAWPTEQIDHRDTDPANFKIDNLREADDAQNRANTPIYRNNTSGFKGVYFHKLRGTWHASIAFRGKSKHLGTFPTREAAGAAYMAAADRLHGEFANASPRHIQQMDTDQ